MNTDEQKSAITNWLKKNDIQFEHSDDHWTYKADINGISTLMSIFALEKGYVQLADFQLEIEEADTAEILPLINAINTKLPYGNLEINQELLHLKLYHFWHEPEQISKSLEIISQNITYFVVRFYSIVRACIENIISTEDAMKKLP